MQQRRSINDIDFWRIVFTIAILLFHLNTFIPVISTGWYICADFFFIVSGYLLYEKKDKYVTSLDYLKDKYKKMYPVYLFSFLCTAVFYGAYSGMIQRLSDVRTFFFENFQEMLMLQGLCIGRGWTFVNITTWYIPIMIMAGFVYVFLLHLDKKVGEHFLIPLLMAYSFSMIYKDYICLDITLANSEHLLINPPLFRAFLGMGLGIYANIYNKWLNEKCTNHQNLRLLVKVSGSLCFVGVLVGSALWRNSRMDFVYLALLFYAVSTAFVKWNENKAQDTPIRRFICYLSSVTINMYLLQEIFRAYVIPKLLFKREAYSVKATIAIVFVYLLMVIASAILVDFVGKAIRKKKRAA